MPDGTFQGKRVSDEWDVILTDAAKRVNFRLNSGRRTMAEQWGLYRLYRSGRGNLAAFPNPNAPHIKQGRPNHSLDVDTYAGQGENALQRELNRMGLNMINDVAGEAWHMTEPDANRLRRVAGRLRAEKVDVTPTLRRLEEGVMIGPSVRRLQGLLRGAGYRSTPLNSKYDRRTRTNVRRFQRKYHIPLDRRTTVGDKTWQALIKVNR